MIRILYNPVASVFLYPIRFYSSTTQLLPARSTLVHACLLQYKGIRLYTDVKVRNKVEEHRILTYEVESISLLVHLLRDCSVHLAPDKHGNVDVERARENFSNTYVGII